MAESRIVSATGSAASSKNKDLSKAIEKAMSDAVMKCNETGITDPAMIKENMMAARKQVVANFAKDEQLASQQASLQQKK